MKFMKIPNKAVIALIIVYLVVGLIALPFTQYLWQMSHFVVILAVGFLLNLRGSIGAGDAKFAAAMAPLVVFDDIKIMFYLFAAVLLAAVLTHRLFKRYPASRTTVPDWASWSNKDFPMGLALGGTLLFYVVLGALFGT